MHNYINKTGYIISLHIGDKFVTCLPDGKPCELLEEFESISSEELIFKRLKKISILNFPEEDEKIIIVNKIVAFYCYFTGIKNVAYLDGGYVKINGNSISSKILVKV
jgi:hypothetical protein